MVINRECYRRGLPPLLVRFLPEVLGLLRGVRRTGVSRRARCDAFAPRVLDRDLTVAGGGSPIRRLFWNRGTLSHLLGTAKPVIA